MASLSSNGAGANPTNNSIAQNPSGPRLSGRQPVGGKGTDTGRRQSGSPVDGSQRRNNPAKAWNSNSNSASQKASSFHSHQNGGSARKAPLSPKPSPSKESNTPDLHAHDRLVFILTAAIGQTTTITTKSGEKFSGVFSNAALEPNDTSFILKMAQRTQAGTNGVSQENNPYLGQPPDHQMVFEAQEIADIDIAALSTTGMMSKDSNGPALNFRTDSDISGNQPGRERQLQRWEPGEDAMDLSLETSGSTNWDQFETNARLFGATSSYDENLYTTRIDRSDPSYKRKEAEAARIAREIESSETDNVHLREERGHVQTSEGIDEEDKYSGVRRDESNFPPLISGQPNKYTPPARRPPAGQPTVPGAPVDPAIISAQVARPDGSKRPPPPKTSATPPPKHAEAIEQDNGADVSKVVPGGSTTSASQRTGGVENAASNVETEVLDHFRRFANDEKMKLQERRRNQASYDRTIKLNELMKFSKNFKLRTPVPKDLVPILAKDPGRQEELVERAKRQHEEKVESPVAKASAPRPAESKPARTGGSARGDPGSAPMPPSDRQPYGRGRQGYPPMGPQAGRPLSHQPGHPGRAGPELLSHRLATIQQQRKGAAIATTPQQPPTQEARFAPAGPSAGGDQPNITSPQKPAPTPTPSTKFNVRALEFKPNPAANTFTPAGATAVSPSPASNAPTRTVSRANSPSAFFGSRTVTPASQRPSIKDHFNPVKRMKKEATEQSLRDYSFNGGIPWAYRTAPTWEVSPVNEEKTYADMFKTQAGAASISPQSRSASNPQIPHQHQLPFHLQHGTPNAPPTTGPPHGHLIPPQPPHAAPPHFDDHRMQLSASSSQVYPSPRLQHSPMAYQPSVNSNSQIAMGQPVPPYYMGQGPQHSHVRHYPGGPQFANPQNGMAAPMMSHQPSNGPYMGVPQGMGTPYNPPMQMYSPNPAHAYPQPAQPPLQPHSGYPSPSRGAPMMMHQGSQQGQPHQPVMGMNNGQHAPPFYAPQQPNHMPPVRGGHNRQHPHFSSSPHQSHHYPHHPYRNQNNNYNHNNNQISHMPPPPIQSQGPPQLNSAGPHPPDSTDEAK